MDVAKWLFAKETPVHLRDQQDDGRKTENISEIFQAVLL